MSHEQSKALPKHPSSVEGISAGISRHDTIKKLIKEGPFTFSFPSLGIQETITLEGMNLTPSERRAYKIKPQ